MPPWTSSLFEKQTRLPAHSNPVFSPAAVNNNEDEENAARVLPPTFGLEVETARDRASATPSGRTSSNKNMNAMRMSADRATLTSPHTGNTRTLDRGVGSANSNANANNRRELDRWHARRTTPLSVSGPVMRGSVGARGESNGTNERKSTHEQDSAEADPAAASMTCGWGDSDFAPNQPPTTTTPTSTTTPNSTNSKELPTRMQSVAVHVNNTQKGSAWIGSGSTAANTRPFTDTRTQHSPQRTPKCAGSRQSVLQTRGGPGRAFSTARPDSPGAADGISTTTNSISITRTGAMSVTLSSCATTSNDKSRATSSRNGRCSTLPAIPLASRVPSLAPTVSSSSSSSSNGRSRSSWPPPRSFPREPLYTQESQPSLSDTNIDNDNESPLQGRETRKSQLESDDPDVDLAYLQQARYVDLTSSRNLRSVICRRPHSHGFPVDDKDGGATGLESAGDGTGAQEVLDKGPPCKKRRGAGSDRKEEVGWGRTAHCEPEGDGERARERVGDREKAWMRKRKREAGGNEKDAPVRPRPGKDKKDKEIENEKGYIIMELPFESIAVVVVVVFVFVVRSSAPFLL
jgi:hypothetical protein